MNDKTLAALTEKLDRLIEVVGRLSPPQAEPTDLSLADCFIWSAELGILEPVHRVNRVDIGLIRGVDRVRDILWDNTTRFADDLPANNVLLWGARGMGKSSLVKAIHAAINAARDEEAPPLKLVEIHREDIGTLPKLMGQLKSAPWRFILFCDDLSFDHDDTSYKSLKAALEGGVEGPPSNVIFYATSNPRHLLPRGKIDNESSTAINPGEAVEEKVSLSDRFGLWLGFHKCSQEDYLEMIDAYAAHHGLEIEPERLRADALEWATTRGGRSGRVAWQFTQDLAGRLGKKLRD